MSKKENEQKNDFDEIKESGSLTIKNGRHNIFCLTIIQINNTDPENLSYTIIDKMSTLARQFFSYLCNFT